jgi:hypothetical protein
MPVQYGDLQRFSTESCHWMVQDLTSLWGREQTFGRIQAQAGFPNA